LRIDHREQQSRTQSTEATGCGSRPLSEPRPAGSTANCPPVLPGMRKEWFSRSEGSADTGHPGETSRCFAERGSESDRRLVREHMLQAVQGTKNGLVSHIGMPPRRIAADRHTTPSYFDRWRIRSAALTLPNRLRIEPPEYRPIHVRVSHVRVMRAARRAEQPAYSQRSRGGVEERSVRQVARHFAKPAPPSVAFVISSACCFSLLCASMLRKSSAVQSHAGASRAQLNRRRRRSFLDSAAQRRRTQHTSGTDKAACRSDPCCSHASPRRTARWFTHRARCGHRHRRRPSRSGSSCHLSRSRRTQDFGRWTGEPSLHAHLRANPQRRVDGRVVQPSASVLPSRNSQRSDSGCAHAASRRARQAPRYPQSPCHAGRKPDPHGRNSGARKRKHMRRHRGSTLNASATGS
jgi:hypothetical protein